MSRNTRFFCLAAALGFFSTGAFGQSMDALLDKLVDKGVLSVKEAKELREESDKNSTKAHSAKTGMPEWVTSFKWNGDFRSRFEENSADNPEYHTRDRYRIRARMGAYIGFVDQFDVGIRLASGNPQTNPGGTLVGGAPMSANADLNSLQSRKFIWLDAAYGRWTPLNTPLWYASGTIGKMDPFFDVSNMIWDYDIDPEGAALTLAHSFDRDQTQTIKLNAAAFILDELNQSVPAGTTNLQVNHDPFVLGAQLLWEANWRTNMMSSLGVAMFGINSKDSLSALAQPFYNSGNTRDASTGVLVYNYNPIVGTVSFTYVLDSFPYYQGPFPVKPNAEFMYNTAAPKNNEAYRVGLQLGKAGKRHTWELNYRYQRLEADAWFDALVDEDNGAFYATGNPQLAGTGKKNGWFGGTNVRGHFLQGTYSFTDYLNFTFTYYLNQLIINAPKQDSDAGHFMADLMWRF